MKSVFREIHRRSLWQVLGIYLASGWLALQVVGTLADVVGIPDWFGPVAIGLLIIGLPIVMATAFVQRGGPAFGKPAARPFADPEPTTAAAEPTTGGTPAASAPAPQPAAAHRLFTWRNAIAGGVVAFSVLAFGTVGWFGMRALGIGPAATLVAQGVIGERPIVVLADFDAEDDALSRLATEAFRMDLSQSRVVRLAEPATVSETLERMARAADEELDRSLAREVAQREGYPAIIVGEITGVGGGHRLSAQLVSAESGEILASHRETARDSTEILDAIDELSTRLRERIGESLVDLRAEPALEQATTSNLEALRKYSQAERAIYVEGDVPRGIILLEEAVALDTAFAFALARLSITLINLGQERDRQVEMLSRAYRHRDRLTEKERYRVSASYAMAVTGDRAASITGWEGLLAVDPENYTALANLSDLYLYMRDYERALDYGTRAMSADSTEPVAYWNSAEALARMGRFDEAESTISSFFAMSAENPFMHEILGLLQAVRGDLEGAETTFEGIREQQLGDPFWRATAPALMAAAAAGRGQLGRAHALLDESMRAHAERSLTGEYLRSATWSALLDVRVARDPAAALARLDRALDRAPIEDVTPLDRPYPELALVYAEAGRPERARELLLDFEASIPSGVSPGLGLGIQVLIVAAPERSRAHAALAEGRFDEAQEDFRRSDVGYCRICALPGLARAYDEAGEADSAIAVYERYLDTPEPYRLWHGDPYYLAPSHERLGQLYDEVGDLDNAAEHYAAFVELWADADPELQPRVAAAQNRLQQILEARG